MKIGIFGKLPAHGDFLSHHLPNSFTGVWDAWLRESLAASKSSMPAQWLDNYLNSPVWQFCLSPGIIDDLCWMGILMPSVDRVGRYYPLTLASPFEVGQGASGIMQDHSEWLNQLESLAIQALEHNFEGEDLLKQVESLSSPPLLGEASFAKPNMNIIDDTADSWALLSASSPSLHYLAYPRMIESMLKERFGHYSLWSTSGNVSSEPAFIAARHLPQQTQFNRLLGGALATQSRVNHPAQARSKPTSNFVSESHSHLSKAHAQRAVNSSRAVEVVADKPSASSAHVLDSVVDLLSDDSATRPIAVGIDALEPNIDMSSATLPIQHSEQPQVMQNSLLDLDVDALLDEIRSDPFMNSSDANKSSLSFDEGGDGLGLGIEDNFNRRIKKKD